MKKKFVSVLIVSAMSATLAGCSFSIPGISSGVSNASDVIDKYNDVIAESYNYHADVNMNVDIAANAQGMSVELPIQIQLSTDVLDGSCHGNMDMSMSFMGESMNQSLEVYLDAGKRSSTMYTYNSEDGYWTVSESENGAEMVFGFARLDADDFKNAKMEHDKTDKTYTITQTFEDFAGSGSMYEMIEGMYGNMAESMSIDTDDILDSWEDAEVIYTFDNDYCLTNVIIDGCEYSDTISQGGTDIDVSVKLDMDFEFSDYGKIEESDVKIPKKVTDSAVSDGEIDHGTLDGGVDEDGKPLFGEHNPPEGPVEITVNEPETVDAQYGGAADPLDPEFSVQPVTGSDLLGSYNGISLTAFGDSWDTTFGADGWTFANNDGEYSFMTAENAKYEKAELYVYNKSRSNTTRSDIINDGSYGYNIDCTLSSNYPNMTWNGLTFGANADSIIAAYGTPDYVYNGTTYDAYQYDITDDIEMEFYVSHIDGLYRVSVEFFGGI